MTNVIFYVLFPLIIKQCQPINYKQEFRKITIKYFGVNKLKFLIIYYAIINRIFKGQITQMMNWYLHFNESFLSSGLFSKL